MDGSARREIAVTHGIEYAVHDGVKLTGDFFRPKGAGLCPVLVAVHGGAFYKGNSKYFHDWGEWLALRGIAVFSINYRLVRGAENKYPAAITDVRSAVQFVRAESADMQVDPDRIGMMGASAGAYLTAMTALAHDAAPFAGRYPSDKHAKVAAGIKVAIPICGVYDMLTGWEHDQLTRPLDKTTEGFLGTTPMEDRQKYFEASPISYSTLKHSADVSFLVSWGTEDDVVDWSEQSMPLVKALKRANYFVRIVPVPAAPHFWIYGPVEEPHSPNEFFAPKLLRFLNERL